MESKSIKPISIILGIMAIYYVLYSCFYCYNNIHVAITTDYNDFVFPSSTVSIILTLIGFAWYLLLMIWFLIVSGGTKKKAFGVMAVIALSLHLLVTAGNLFYQLYLHSADLYVLTTYYTAIDALNGIGSLLLGIAFIIMGRHLPEKTRKWSIAIGICILVLLVFWILHSFINSYISCPNTPQDHVRNTYLTNALFDILTMVKFVFMAIFFFLCSKRDQQHSASITGDREVTQ